MKYEIVKLKKENAPAVFDLYSLYREKPYPVNKIEEIIDNLPSVGVFSKGALLGFCYTEYFCPDILEIGNIFVKKELRNQGIGKVLLEKVHEISVAEKGINTFIVSNSFAYQTKETKISARSFYLRCGYKLAVNTDKTDVYIYQI